MKKQIQALFDELKSLPFPSLGKVAGDFVLYDSLLAGTADSYLAGKHLHENDIPGPDEQTEQVLVLIKNKQKRSKEECEFLEYTDLLETIRSELMKLVRGRKSQSSDTKAHAV